jgi:hypothetical protein
MKFLILTSCLLGISWAKAIQEDIDYQKDGLNEDYYANDQDYLETVENFNIPADNPHFVSSGGHFIVGENSELTLPCQVNDLGVRQMIWMKRPGVKGAEDILYLGEKELTKSPRRSLAQVENNQGTILTISQATNDDAGTYICKIATPSNDLFLEFHVKVGDSHGNHPRQGQALKDGSSAGVMASSSVSLLTLAVTYLLL